MTEEERKECPPLLQQAGCFSMNPPKVRTNSKRLCSWRPHSAVPARPSVISEGKRLFISCFDRIFTVWRCSRLSLKNPVWKEGAGKSQEKEPAAGKSRRRAGMTPSFLCNRQRALRYCSLWSSAIPPIEFVKNDWCSNSSHKGLKEMIWIGFSFGRVGGSTWRGGPEPCWKELVLWLWLWLWCNKNRLCSKTSLVS